MLCSKSAKLKIVDCPINDGDSGGHNEKKLANKSGTERERESKITPWLVISTSVQWCLDTLFKNQRIS